MSSENSRNVPSQSIPVYIHQPGVYQGGTNYVEHHQSHPQTPPPKYEDVIGDRSNAGIPAELRPAPEPSGAGVGPEPTGIIFVTPLYKYMKTQITIGFVFTILFLAAFVSVLIKILTAV